MPFFPLNDRTLRVSILALGALTLTGCAGVATIPDTPLPTSSVQPGSIQGSVFGGHAPIVGAHVYVLQAGTGGYASPSTSLINTTTALADPNGKYILTASDGTFNVTGDYSCTTGLPVYLAATGGQTATNIGGANYSTFPINITSATSTYISSLSEYALTFTANNLLYPGQSVTLSGLTGTWAGFNGLNTVAGATDTTFTLPLYSSNVTGTTTGTAVPSSAINPAIANLAVLGNCPTTGNFSTSGAGSDVISYVWMNEVSTTAAAYALSGFGSGPFSIGIPAGDPLAKTGIQIAANNASQLYSIQGAYLSTTFAGEGHIANPYTPAGNGVVPQSTLDTLGNILASCVDSNNLTSSVPNATGASTSCSKLFTYATSNGIPYGSTGVGTLATDTATAAFNIAHNPAGNLSYTGSFMASLFALQGTEVTPFTPALSAAPSDFAIAINYPSSYTTGLTTTTVPYLVGPQAVSVDASGDIWFTSQPIAGSNASGYLSEFSPLGVKLYSNLNTAWMYGDIAIDSTGDAWTGNQGNYVLATEVLPPHGATTTYTTQLQGSNYTYAEGVTADGVGDVFVPHGPTTQNVTIGTPPSDNDQTLTELNTAGVVSVGTTGNMEASFPVNAYMTHAAIDNTGAIWFTSNNGNVIARVASATGTAITAFPITATTATTACPSSLATTILSPEQPAVDAANNAWVPLYNAGAGTAVLKISSAGGCTSFGNFNGPYGTTVDGADNLWVTNGHNNSISVLSTSASTTTTPSSYTAGGLVSGPQGIAVDLSGDLIIANYKGNSVLEVIGAATPTYAPLGVAAAKSKLGAQP